MARVQIGVFRVTRFDFLPDQVRTVGDTTDGNFFINNGGTYLHVINNDVSNDHDFDLYVLSNVDITQAVDPRTYTVPANFRGQTGLFPREIYGETVLIDPSSTDLEFVGYSLI